MEGDDLLAEHVLARGQVGRQREVPLAAGGDQRVDGPGVAGAVVPDLVDLGPGARGARVLEVLGNPGDEGPLVRRGDDVVAAVVVVPLEGHLVARRGADKVADGGAAGGVAHQVLAGHVLDGVVGAGGTDVGAAAVTLELIVDVRAIDAGVGGDASHEGGSDGGSGEVHFDKVIWVLRNVSAGKMFGPSLGTERVDFVSKECIQRK